MKGQAAQQDMASLFLSLCVHKNHDNLEYYSDQFPMKMTTMYDDFDHFQSPFTQQTLTIFNCSYCILPIPLPMVLTDF